MGGGGRSICRRVVSKFLDNLLFWDEGGSGVW
jgi:hypothetical protein